MMLWPLVLKEVVKEQKNQKVMKKISGFPLNLLLE
jgi:hypothetical protein